MSGKLEGKVALVTGGARGIGAAIVRRLHADGARVAITDVLDDAGRALAAELGERTAYFHHDVGDEAAWVDTLAAATARFGGLHVLVNNAGIFHPGQIADAAVSDVEQQFRVNQLGPFLGMKHAQAPLRAAGGGSIVNISSIAGQLGFPNAAAYVGTKWAVRGMTKTAALELAPAQIRVNSVHPGFIDTPMLDNNPPEANQAGIEATPLKRIGKPEEIAAAVAFLAGPDAGFVTGAELTVDGGWIL
ncbi:MULTISPECIES: SDR family NAD(P)-dependent oxidoreductase [Thermomonas]|jgi:3alpha(or 20beta)-hydroxysteroid dehydrogenase|uniref:SDR family NAD(P)-dependent oxidoreductase n=1 Tax=Thermomonas TaxID=141948 RepID=UPI0003F6F7C1|nr:MULTISPECIES: glucose 1-dehydrogenase [Thermomonas]